jgi:hypothetical protein
MEDSKMKHLISTLAILSICVSACAQGQVNFNTHIPSDTPPIDFKFFTGWPDLRPVAGWYAQLVAVNGSSYQPMIEPPAIINAAGYVSAGAATFAGLAPGTSAFLVIRTWTGSSTFDGAIWKVQSAQFSVTFAVPPNPPGDLLTLGTGGVVWVPEPTPLALGALSLSVLLICRRKG